MDKQKELGIRHYCKEAKKRLGSGFWDSYRTNRENLEYTAATRGVSAQTEIYREKIAMTKMIYEKSKYEEDEEFYKKVCDILDSQEVVLNPIMQLADKEYMATLSYSARQKYLLVLSEKYHEMCSRYEIEKRNKKG